MSWSEIEHHQRASSILRQAIRNERIAHAYLFSGQEGIGKLKVAAFFARALNCETTKEEPCGSCRNCDMLARSMDPDMVVHPDLVHLAPGRWRMASGQVQASHTIVIDAVRDLCSSLYAAPLMAKRRVVIVHEADTMQVSAQNAFLKTLEEPMESLRTVFILLTARPLRLLPTVRSRCQNIYFGTVSDSRIISYLREELGLDEGLASRIASYSEGNLQQALEIGRNEEDVEDELDRRGRWLDLWQQAVFDQPGDYDLIVDEFSRSRDKLKEFLSLMISWHRDLLMIGLGSRENRVTNVDRLSLLRAQSERMSGEQIVQRIERMLYILEGMEVYIRGDLALNSMMAEIVAEPATLR